METDVGSVRELLNTYRDGEKEIENLTEALERLKNKLVGVGAQEITDMPRSPSPPNDRITDLLCRKVELEEEIRCWIEIQTKRRQSILDATKRLRTADERAVIRFRYLLCLSWYEVANAMFGANHDYLDKEDSYLRRAHKVHGRALSDMALCIEGEWNQ